MPISVIVWLMPWYPKEAPTPFDNEQINGLAFLDGDILAALMRASWVKGEKFPVVFFPSGEQFQIWEGESSPIVHIFGEMDLAIQETSRDEAFAHANDIAEACGYLVKKIGNTQLEVWGRDPDEHFILTFDNNERSISDIQQIKDQQPLSTERIRGHQLLTDELRQQLPPLYSNEEIGMDAPALVKYFTPDSNWTWYASEFNGKETFFGLVSGFDVELGYFSLSELDELRGPMGLPIERDLHFEPTTLRELKAKHERGE